MTEENRSSGLTAEEEGRWNKAWAEASEFERRRFRSLEGPDKLAIMVWIPEGTVATLGAAIKKATGGFEEFIERRDGGAQRDA
jgi:hypothetical protein